MKKIDRMMAITRHPDYISDHEKFMKLHKDCLMENDETVAMRKVENVLSFYRNEFIGKWKLVDFIRIPPPDPYLNYKAYEKVYEDHGITVINDMVRDFTYGEEYLRKLKIIFENLINKYAPKRVEDTESDMVNGRKQYIPDVRGSFIYLIVDMKKKKTDLAKEFEEILNRHLLYDSGSVGRHRHLKVSPWKVYDLVHLEGLNIYQIAKKISGKSGGTAYEPELDKVHKRVERAYKKAKDMINAVSRCLPDIS